MLFRSYHFAFLGLPTSLGCLGDEEDVVAKASCIRFGRPNHLITKTAVGLCGHTVCVVEGNIGRVR